MSNELVQHTPTEMSIGLTTGDSLDHYLSQLRNSAILSREEEFELSKKLFESNDLDNEDFIERMNAELDNDQPSLIGGGNIVEASEILQKKREPNLLSEVYDINDNVISGKCDNMRNMNNVTLDGLQYMNHC